MPHATLPSPGLQALILCGPGVSLNTFTSNPRDLPKALIPIANRPMVWYPLDWCYRAGLTDITLITPFESGPAIRTALSTHPALTSLPNPKPEILSPEQLLPTTGTSALLRLPEVQAAITGDFVVLPCDLVSEVEGSGVVQQWMTLNPLSSSSSTQRRGGLSVFYPTQGLEGISTKKDESDFLSTVQLPSPPVLPPPGSLRGDIEEIVTCMPTDTLNDKLEEDKGFLRVRQSLLSRHSRVKIRMRHRDAHIYVFPSWIKEFIARNEVFESVSEDVLGWWAKAGWQRGLAEKLGLEEVLREGSKKKTSVAEDEDVHDDGEEEEEIDPATLSSTRAQRTSQPVAPQEPQFATRVSITHASPRKPKPPIAIPPLLAYIQPSPTSESTLQPLIRRVDTSHQLAAISLLLAKQAPSSGPLSHEAKVHPTATIGAQTRLSTEDSLIAENVTIGTRCAIKECVIGASCEIGSNVRLTKCVLMEGVVVGDGAVLTGCIVGRRARVEAKVIEGAEGEAREGGKGKGKQRRKGGDGEDDDKTRLTDCEVAPYFVVEAGTEAKGEKLMAFDTEGLDEEDEDDGGDEVERMDDEDE